MAGSNDLRQQDKHPGQFGHLLIWIALLGGALLRLYGLGAESIWLDEATSILLGKADILTLVRTTAQDIHPPIYYLLLHFWLRLGDSEFLVRALSAFIGVISMAVIYQLGKDLFEAQVGTVAALLLAISPLHIWYSQEARMYILVTLLSMAGSYWLWKALPPSHASRHHALHTWAAYVLCMVLALYTHYHAIFVLLFQSCFAAIWCGFSTHRRWLARNWLLAQGVLLLLFLPWIPVLLSQVAQGGGSWVAKVIGQPAPRAILGTWIEFSIGNTHPWYPVWLRRIGYGLFALASLAALAAPLRTRRLHTFREADQLAWGGYLFVAMYLVVPLGAAWLVSQLKPMYAQRYLLPFLPAYLLLIATGIQQIPWVMGRLGLLVALSAICLTGVAIASYYPQKDDWRGATEYLLQNVQPGDAVVFVPLWNYKPFAYYAERSAMVPSQVQLYSSLPVPIPADADLPFLLGSALTDHARLWLIWSAGHYADPAGSVQRYLDSRFPRLLRGDFSGVGRISLYQIATQP